MDAGTITELPTTPGMEEVEQRRERLPTTPGTTPWMAEVEQRREQLPVEEVGQRQERLSIIAGAACPISGPVQGAPPVQSPL